MKIREKVILANFSIRDGWKNWFNFPESDKVSPFILVLTFWLLFIPTLLLVSDPDQRVFLVKADLLWVALPIFSLYYCLFLLRKDSKFVRVLEEYNDLPKEIKLRRSNGAVYIFFSSLFYTGLVVYALPTTVT